MTDNTKWFTIVSSI